MVVPPVPMAKLVTKARADHPAQPAQLEKTATRVPQETTARSAQANPVLLAPPALLANPAQLVLLLSPARLARMAHPDPLAHPEMLEPQVDPARLVAQEAPANLARMVPQAAASTAHQLVWPLVTKNTDSMRSLVITWSHEAWFKTWFP